MNGKKKVLVVQEDVIVGDVLAIKFKKLEYLVDKARDGVVALQKIRAEKPDCIILDILMSRKGGIGLFEQLKGDVTLRDIPVVITASSEERDEVKHAKELGARDFVIKPIFDPAAVIAMAQQAMSGVVATPMAASVTMATPAAVPSAPVAPAPPTTPVQVPASTTEAPVTIQSTPTATMSPSGASGKPFVLVVEDDKFLRELLVRKLSSEGFDVKNAIDATAAFVVLAERKPAIILLDLILPEVSGFEILQRIKADPKIADVPVIILSNLGQKEDTDKALALGAKDFMVKANFTLDEITAKVRATIA